MAFDFAQAERSVGVKPQFPMLPLPPRPQKVAGTFSAKVPATFLRAEALAYLEQTLSHPRWLAAKWLDRYGFEAAERWAAFDNAAAALTLRVNTGTTRNERAIYGNWP